MHKTQVGISSYTDRIEEKVGMNHECIGTRDYFLNITPRTQKLRVKNNKWNLLKWKIFSKLKDIVNKKSYRMGKYFHQYQI